MSGRSYYLVRPLIKPSEKVTRRLRYPRGIAASCGMTEAWLQHCKIRLQLYCFEVSLQCNLCREHYL